MVIFSLMADEKDDGLVATISCAWQEVSSLVGLLYRNTCLRATAHAVGYESIAATRLL